MINDGQRIIIYELLRFIVSSVGKGLSGNKSKLGFILDIMESFMLSHWNDLN